MDTIDQLVYGGCWVVLGLYIVATLAVFVRRSCVSHACAFLLACALWLDLSLFNVWFMLPALAQHVRDALQSGSSVAALQDLGLMALGWSASALAMSNSAAMMGCGGCARANPVARLADHVMMRYVGFHAPDLALPGATDHRRTSSALFAFPRLVHAYLPRGLTGRGRAETAVCSETDVHAFPDEKTLLQLSGETV
ncbi:hypothetical protein F4780DRAFT_563682 [Xylariomycetidae sp. FL0641]|nr:hypothetical protein F4780DRAFT_563682 [Xylariomycetidae sp. FL0641]